MNKEELIEIIQNFNFQEIKNRIQDEKRLINYQKWLCICLHVCNALSIILSVLGETIQDKIIYAVIVCNILTSILNYEYLKAHTTLLTNTKIINEFLKQNHIESKIFVPNDHIFGHTPNNTPMISV
jgi:hypothetical protein